MAAAAGEQLSFDSALAATLQDLKLSFSLRNEQRTALKSFLEKKDVFRVLPTGYGKSYVVSILSIHHSQHFPMEISVALTTSPSSLL